MIPVRLTDLEIERAKGISCNVCKEINYAHIKQTEAELAVCNLFGVILNRSFSKALLRTIDISGLDNVDDIEVRVVFDEDEFLPLFQTDNKNSIYILVNNCYKPNFLVHGWCVGKNLMIEKYLEKSTNDNSLRYSIPCKKLTSMEALLRLKKP